MLEVVPAAGPAVSAGRSFVMTAGQTFEEIALRPGGWSEIRDRGTPAMIRRAEPADPALRVFVERVAREASIEMGLNGRLGVAFFVCTTPTETTSVGDGGLGLRFRLDGFSTTATEPSSIWIRLDGRRANVAELRHLVRHEMGHLGVELVGLPSGPVAESAADLFADGGMPALAAGLGLGAERQQLPAPQPAPALGAGDPTGTIIIDGTSDMFKIAATGTITVNGVDGSGAGGGTATATVTITTGFTYRPAHLIYAQFAGGLAGLTPSVQWDVSNGFPQSGHITDAYNGWVEAVIGNATKVTCRWATRLNRSGSSVDFRYYVLVEAAI